MYSYEKSLTSGKKRIVLVMSPSEKEALMRELCKGIPERMSEYTPMPPQIVKDFVLLFKEKGS